ncbi:MAG: 7-carboxy-7-deazaguanine synthase QueE [Opitutales bacterium]|nr:7-carboxy-7-deazaguanine synthase QueE [Opitutales bacterium]
MANYPVVETFYSVQGEGLFAGAGAYFVRLFGCPVKCAWCDTKNSWSGSAPNFMSDKQIANQASLTSCDFAVITGGEPTIHPLQELVDSFRALGIKTHLETSGYMPKNVENIDWITLSPKLHSHTHESYLVSADELKFIVSNAEEIELYMEKFGEYFSGKKAVFIVPEFSKSRDSELLSEICEAVKLYGFPLRAGWQLHKSFGAV